jgi:hypothetical protein
VFNHIRAQTFKANIIKSAFKKTGLFPYNPDKVMHTLYKEEEEEETLPAHFNIDTTSRKISKLETYGEELYRMVQDRSSPLINAIVTFAKDAMARVYSGQQAEIDLAIIQTAQRERATRGKNSCRSIQKGGVIYVSQARKRIQARNQRDDDLDARKLTRADLATRRRLFKVFEQCVAVRREAIRQIKTQPEYRMEY